MRLIIAFSFGEMCVGGRDGKIWKNSRFSEQVQPDWGNIAQAATAGLGSIRLIGLNVYDYLFPILPFDSLWCGV